MRGCVLVCMLVSHQPPLHVMCFVLQCACAKDSQARIRLLSCFCAGTLLSAWYACCTSIACTPTCLICTTLLQPGHVNRSHHDREGGYEQRSGGAAAARGGVRAGRGREGVGVGVVRFGSGTVQQRHGWRWVRVQAVQGAHHSQRRACEVQALASALFSRPTRPFTARPAGLSPNPSPPLPNHNHDHSTPHHLITSQTSPAHS